jgi:hypothetical protein
LLREVFDGGVCVADAEVEDGGVTILGRACFVGLESRPNAFDDGLSPDAVVFVVWLSGVEEVSWGRD